MPISSLPAEPLSDLKTAFGAHFKTFEDALKTASTTLEAQRGKTKDQQVSLVEACKISPLNSGSLANALLKYFDDQPPPDGAPPAKKLRTEQELKWDKSLYANVRYWQVYGTQLPTVHVFERGQR